MWTQDIQSGAHSDARSWSVLLAGLVDKASSVPEKDAPQAWAWGDLTPAKVPNPPPTDTVELAGETEPGKVRVLTDAEKIPARMAAMPAGYVSIDTMLTTPCTPRRQPVLARSLYARLHRSRHPRNRRPGDLLPTDRRRRLGPQPRSDPPTSRPHRTKHPSHPDDLGAGPDLPDTGRTLHPHRAGSSTPTPAPASSS